MHSKLPDLRTGVSGRAIQLFREKFGAARLGDPLNPATSHGPQIDLLQYTRIKEYVAIGEKDGTLTLGGDVNDGFFVRPTVFEGVAENSRLMQEEAFGPVVVINTFSRRTKRLRRHITRSLGFMLLS